MFRNISIVERITIDCCRLKVTLFLMQRVTIQKLKIMELQEYILNYTVLFIKMNIQIHYYNIYSEKSLSTF